MRRLAAILLSAVCIDGALGALLDASLIQTDGVPSVGSGKFYGYRSASEGPGDDAFTLAYDTALAIIRKGQERLKATPRADMDGFVPCAENKSFETRYRKRLECERRSYNAIRAGRTIYDD